MNAYLGKYGFKDPQITDDVPHDLNMMVVIPCHNETRILTTLTSLEACVLPNNRVEVIVVVNHGIGASKELVYQNEQTVASIAEWKKGDFNLIYHVIYEDQLPKKHAGVGLARKIGMDEAVSRFHQINHDGIIVCLDADCTVESNYLVELEKHFEDNPKTPGCAIKYEHPLTGTDYRQENYTGIINYELFLRYYNLGLIYAGFPYGYHTVGSSMAARSSAYQKQGGMNKRKAGEDFYFLHKIIKLGRFTELNTTAVFPSPRTSDRVPFGTGKAINDFLERENFECYPTYDFSVFRILKEFISEITNIYKADNYVPRNEVLNEFLNDVDFDLRIKEIKKNTTSFESFEKRFFQFFDAFKVLKFVHFARDNGYPNKEIKEEVLELCGVIKLEDLNNTMDKKTLLLHLRELEAKR